MKVVAVNESSIVSPHDWWNIVWAINYQAHFQFQPYWDRAAQVTIMPESAKPPSGAAVLHCLDNADQQGALGYHDEDDNEVAVLKIFAETAHAAGNPLSEVASHELLEALVDEHVNDSSFDGSSRFYAKEVGDPVQGTSYDVGAPYGRTTGIIVANFVLPAWFDPNTRQEQVDFRHALSAPFSRTPQGYFQYLDIYHPQQGWQAEGAEHAPDWDDRHLKRLAS